MPSCSVYKCSHSPGQVIDGKRISFHKFPNRIRSPVRHEAWVNKISRVGFVPSATSVVCSNHFTLADFHTSAQLKVDFGLFATRCNPVLMKSAIPSKNMKGFQGSVSSPSTSASEPQSKRRRNESVYIRKKTVADAMENAGANTLTDVEVVISEPDITIYDAIADDRGATRDIGIQCNLIGDDLADNVTSACDVGPGERLDSSYVPTIEDHTDEDDDNRDISDDGSDNEGSECNADNNRPKADSYDSFIVLWDCLKLLFCLLYGMWSPSHRPTTID
jgi:THAP domain